MYNKEMTNTYYGGTPINLKDGDTLSFKITNAQPNASVVLGGFPLDLFGVSLASATNLGGSGSGFIGRTDDQGNFTYTSIPLRSSVITTPTATRGGGTGFSFSVSVGNDIPHARQLGNLIWANFGDANVAGVVTGNNPGVGSGTVNPGVGQGIGASFIPASTSTAGGAYGAVESGLAGSHDSNPVVVNGSNGTVNGTQPADTSTQGILLQLQQSLQGIQTSLAVGGKTLSGDAMDSIASVVASITQIIQTLMANGTGH
jgi:hypothetical protein